MKNKGLFTKIVAIGLAIAFLAFLVTPMFNKGNSSPNSTPNNQSIAVKDIPFTKEGDLTLKTAEGKTIKALEIEIADNSYETQTGLMYRSTMAENRGMLFIFDNEAMHSFYMRNTQIPLDIIYINKNKEIVSFAKNAKPFDETSLPSKFPAMYVLEINAGLADQWNLKEGDKIEFTEL